MRGDKRHSTNARSHSCALGPWHWHTTKVGRASAENVYDEEVASFDLPPRNTVNLIAYDPSESARCRFTRTGAIGDEQVVAPMAGGGRVFYGVARHHDS